MASIRRIWQNRTYRDGYDLIDWGKKKPSIPEEEETPEQREQRERQRRLKGKRTLEWLGIP